MATSAARLAVISLSWAALYQASGQLFPAAQAEERHGSLESDRQSRTATGGMTQRLTKFERLAKEPVLGPRAGKFDNAGAFNPTAARLSDGRIILLYRGQDKQGISCVGYGESKDGLHFKVSDLPVLSPTGAEDKDGIEDPRLSRDPCNSKGWLLTATAYNKVAETAQLVGYRSTGEDLNHWHKAGTIMPCGQGKWNKHWTKSGAMVTDDNGVPLKIKGHFWMFYMGDASAAHDQMGLIMSADGVNWVDATNEPVLAHRPGMFDSKVVEPGPHTIITKDGILLLYNGADDNLSYRTGWALFDRADPTRLIARAEQPLFEPETEWEKKNASKEVYQAPNVVFVEGLVPEGKDSYLIYYGCADSYVGVAWTRLEACAEKK